MMAIRNVCVFSAFALSAALLISCNSSSSSGSSLSGSSQSGAASLESLADVPNSSELIATSESGLSALSFAAVSGTPPTLSSITNENAGGIFWPTLDIDAIASGTVDTEPGGDCDSFWGSEQDGNSGGFPACYMAQEVGYSFEALLRAGGSLCYMKNMPTVTTEGVSISAQGDNATLDDQTTIFNQQEEDRLVLIQVSGFPEEEGGSEENIYINVEGSNDVGTNVYEVTLRFCSTGGELRGHETITINKSTGAYTASNRNSDSSGSSNITVQGFLTEDSEGNIRFDEEADRSVTMSHNWEEDESSGSFAASLSISSENIIRSMVRDNNTFGSETFGRKGYSISEFSFDESAEQKVGNIQFRQAAAKDEPVGGDRQDGGFEAAVEYRTDGYYSAADSALSEFLSEVDFSSTAFYQGDLDTSVTLDTDSFPCTGLDPDYIVTMDFSEEEDEDEATITVGDVAEICDGDRLDGMDFCHNNQSIRDAEEQIITQCFSGPEE